MQWRNAAVPTVITTLTAAALGQQFQDDTAARFPSPDPNDYSNQLTIGDIDADGDLDVIFANGGGFAGPGTPRQQRIYINNGSGVFADESVARLNFTGLCRGAELGDIDGDTDLDLILVQDFDRQPALFVNDGNGFFTNVTTTQLPSMTLSSSRGQFGDIDNDGDLDLYIVSGTTSRFTCGQYRVYVNDGAGFFTDETLLRHPIEDVCNNMDCIFGDIDGDFDLDVRTASTGTNNSRLYRNDGTGVFSTVAGVPADSSCYSYDFGDMDGDGDLDLIGANGGTGTAEILLENDGTGTYTNVSASISPNISQDDNDSKFLDYDNDGDLDLLIARLGSGGEKLYENDGAGSFTQTSGVVQVISDSSLDIGVADLTGDGKLDFVTAQGESGSFVNRIYVNNGPSDNRPPRIIATEQAPSTTDTSGPYVIRAAILDDMTSDRNFFDRGVFLLYTVDDEPQQQVPMRHSGGQIYRGEIPGQPAGSIIDYQVMALDFANNEGTGDTLTFAIDTIPGDVDGDGVIDVGDLLDLLAGWGPCPPRPEPCPADFDGSRTVDVVDLLVMLASWS